MKISKNEREADIWILKFFSRNFIFEIDQAEDEGPVNCKIEANRPSAFLFEPPNLHCASVCFVQKGFKKERKYG